MYTMTHSCVLNIFKTSAYRQLWIFNMYTPGQWPNTHVLESREEPIHCLPPFWGGGLSHSLVRNCSPTPQVLLHNPQDVHSENRPWTVNRPNQIKYNLSFTNLLVKLVLDPVFSVVLQASLMNMTYLPTHNGHVGLHNGDPQSVGSLTAVQSCIRHLGS